MAGPWFTVHESGAGWKVKDRIWISNGQEALKARVEGRVTLEPPPAPATPREGGTR